MARRVSELEGAELDYWVGMIEGVNKQPGAQISTVERHKGRWEWSPHTGAWFVYRPSASWDQGGPIIEREKILVIPDTLIEWDEAKHEHQAVGFEAVKDYGVNYEHSIEGEHSQEGRTYLIAAMRCFVASKFGETVPENDAGVLHSPEKSG